MNGNLFPDINAVDGVSERWNREIGEFAEEAVSIRIDNVSIVIGIK